MPRKVEEKALLTGFSAMELIAELEREKRGVYAGAVGYFGYSSVDGDKEVEGAMDVSIREVPCAIVADPRRLV